VPAGPLDRLRRGDRSKRYARVLRQAQAAVLAADTPPVRLRELIRTSWQRALAAGVDPEHHRPSSAC
jgi:hypothetical protein